MCLRGLLLTGLFLFPPFTYATPVAVKYPEGSVHGYLALRTLSGKLLAAGDLVQTIHDRQLTSRLLYRFQDGSVDEDTAVFTQNGSFRLLYDHHVQKGPSFPKPTDLTIDARTGQVTVRYPENGKLKVETSHMELPADLANGILIDLAKNLSPHTTETEISYLAATPSPRIVRLSFKPDGVDTFRSAGRREKAQRYRVHIQIGGIAGLLASIFGKQPADSVVWVGDGEVPAFIKSESPLYVGGPLLRTELVSPVWASSEATPQSKPKSK